MFARAHPLHGRPAKLNRGDTLKEAIAAATARWINRRVGRTTSRETGIPAELPLLTGLATQFEVLAEMQPEG